MRKAKIEIEHPDHSQELSRLRKILGQIAGIEKMVLSRRYCPEIVQQIRAATSALKALEFAIVKKHISSCVKQSARTDAPPLLDKKLKELLDLFKG
ncbi:MAG: metal-sensitive transcriptional regulator [Bdellovibrionales bacterium]